MYIDGVGAGAVLFHTGRGLFISVLFACTYKVISQSQNLLPFDLTSVIQLIYFGQMNEPNIDNFLKMFVVVVVAEVTR